MARVPSRLEPEDSPTKKAERDHAEEYIYAIETFVIKIRAHFSLRMQTITTSWLTFSGVTN
jgi:hypothetical protein